MGFGYFALNLDLNLFSMVLFFFFLNSVTVLIWMVSMIYGSIDMLLSISLHQNENKDNLCLRQHFQHLVHFFFISIENIRWYILTLKAYVPITNKYPYFWKQQKIVFVFSKWVRWAIVIGL